MSVNPKIAKDKLAKAKVSTATKLVKKIPEKKVQKTSGKLESKEKVVRDSFTMPLSDYSKIAELKQLCQKAGLYVKKSELLRAGLHLLSNLSAAQLKKEIAGIEHIKTGRPKKS